MQDALQDSYPPDQHPGRLYYAKCGPGRRHDYRYDKGLNTKVCSACGNVRGKRYEDHTVRSKGMLRRLSRSAG